MRFIAIVLLLLATPTHAQDVYLNYGQWLQMPIGFREMYVIGSFDTLSTVAMPEQAIIAKHFNECVARARLSSGQLTENMQAYAEARPDLQNKPAATVLVRYLISLCGSPT